MDAEREWEGMNELQPSSDRSERMGLFAQPGMLTSALLPDVTLAFRAYQCRLAMVCDGVQASFTREKADTGGRLRVHPVGCEEFVIQPLDECRFAEADPRESEAAMNLVSGFGATVLETECEPLAEQMADREAAFIRIATAYDAAQRSLLQYAGNFDGFLRGLRGDFLAPLQETIPLLSAFSRIPCFTAQCNE